MFSDTKEPSDLFVFRTVLYYCLLVIAMPVATFFATKVVLFDGIFGMAPMSSNIYSAVATVAVLHLALGLYIYKAYSETPKPSKLE